MVAMDVGELLVQQFVQQLVEAALREVLMAEEEPAGLHQGTAARAWAVHRYAAGARRAVRVELERLFAVGAVGQICVLEGLVVHPAEGATALVEAQFWRLEGAPFLLGEPAVPVPMPGVPMFAAGAAERKTVPCTAF